MPDGPTVLLIFTIVIALGFDFTNGFHDTANSIATTISTRAQSPRAAILTSSLLNFVGAVVAITLLHAKVSNTVGTLVSSKGGISLLAICAALLAAIMWNLITWRAGLPSSSSHAIIGGLLGMGVVAYGTGSIHWGKLGPTLIALVTSPIAGLILAFILGTILLNIFRNVRPSPANRVFRILQAISGAFVSFSHGGNDAQKTMAVITLALLSTHHLSAQAHGFPEPPLWVVAVCALAIASGTYIGGWRIIRTLGSKIIRIEPIDGFVAETVGASIIQGATQLGLPVSTTHVVSGSVMGAGVVRNFSRVRWLVAGNILTAWVLTIPASALLAGILVEGVKLAGWI